MPRKSTRPEGAPKGTPGRKARRPAKPAPDAPRPWFRLEDESEEAYKDFDVYIKMGMDRSLTRVAKHVKKSITHIYATCRENHWYDRALAHDAELMESVHKMQVESLRPYAKAFAARMHARLLFEDDLCETLQERVMEMLNHPLTDTVPPNRDGGPTLIVAAKWDYGKLIGVIELIARIRSAHSDLINKAEGRKGEDETIASRLQKDPDLQGLFEVARELMVQRKLDEGK